MKHTAEECRKVMLKSNDDRVVKKVDEVEDECLNAARDGKHSMWADIDDLCEDTIKSVKNLLENDGYNVEIRVTELRSTRRFLNELRVSW